MSKLVGKNPKKAKPTRPRIVVFGAAGVGKTWTALDFPACYYIDCEGGANLPHYTDKLESVGAAYVGPEDGANDYDFVLGQISALSTEKHDRKTLVIDSHTKLFNTEVQIEYDRIVAAGKKAEFAIEKKPAIGKTRQLIRRMDNLDMNAILICHEKAQWQNGEEVGKTFDSWDKLAYELNLVLQIVKQGNARKAKVVKSRFAEFEENSVIDWCYDTFVQKFGREVLEAKSKSAVAATPEQVAQIQLLVDNLRTDDKIVQKWLDAAGVNQWSEMTGEIIGKCIAHLKKQVTTMGAAS